MAKNDISKKQKVLITLILFSISFVIFNGCLNFRQGDSKTIENKSVDTQINDVGVDSSTTETMKEIEQASESFKSYSAVAVDELGMKWKKETDYYIFYYNETPEDFVDSYISIAESGYPGIEGIFGKPASKIKIYLAETMDEFRLVSNGIVPPGFDGLQAAGQSIGGVVHIYKPSEFKPGNSYGIGLLHEIGHAVYFQLYPNAAKKNDWLSEGLADNSITGLEINSQNPNILELKKAVETGKFIELADLEKNSDRTSDSESEINFIEYSCFVNFIASEFGFDKLQMMLTRYDQGDDLVTALEASTGLSSSEFESKWLDNIKSAN